MPIRPLSPPFSVNVSVKVQTTSSPAATVTLTLAPVTTSGVALPTQSIEVSDQPASICAWVRASATT
jgi:hypothetical protein